MATSFKQTSREDKMIVRDRRLIFVEPTGVRDPARSLFWFVAAAGIIAAVALRGWRRRRAVSRFYALDMRRLRDERLTSVVDPTREGVKAWQQ